MPKLLAIDGFSLLHRAFYAMPFLSNKEGIPTGAITGFFNMFISALEKIEPDYVIVAMDMKGPTFRHKMYNEYKGNRPPMPEDLRPQVDYLRILLKECGITILESEGFEADDVLGTISKKCSMRGFSTIILTGDRDSFQLIDNNTVVWMTRKGISETEVFDLKHLHDVFGLEPKQIIDLKGLMGDSSDNIPGIPMVGQKTALKLLSEYTTLENVLNNIESVSGKKLKENLAQYRDQAILSYRLATINTAVPNIDFNEEKYAFNWQTFNAGRNLLHQLELNSIERKILSHISVPAENKTINLTSCTRITVTDNLKLNSIVQSILKENKRVYVLKNDTAFSITNNSEEVYDIPISLNLIDVDHLAIQEIIDSLKPLFESGIPKCLYDLKKWLHLGNKYGFNIENCCFDILIAAYLIDANANDYSIEKLTSEYLNDINECNIASILVLLENRFIELLNEKKLIDLFNKIEMPLVRVLFDMEIRGFCVDRSILENLNSGISNEIKALEQNIYEECGEIFNINSPKQLSHILFEKLGLKPLKKTKSGYSTDAETLEQLSLQSSFVTSILNFRQLTKLKGTYIDGLIPLIDKDSKIHSTFNQTIASTGRISSSEPNLQNIPVRTPLGREFRKIFISDTDTDLLVDADYSQIELRVLAHLSNDKKMCEAFLNGYDIHKDTASKMWHVKFDDVTNEMRSAAKAINFGIVYGISDFGLSRNIGISVSEAREFIRIYKETYSGVAEYMNDLVATASSCGYAETLFGRRREIRELQSSNFNTRSFGQRIAMNMPIQGTAADIIKLAMIRVNRVLDGVTAKLLLQVHDELIVNTNMENAERVKSIVKKEMESVVQLNVPLVVDVHSGRSWYDAK